MTEFDHDSEYASYRSMNNDSVFSIFQPNIGLNRDSDWNLSNAYSRKSNNSFEHYKKKLQTKIKQESQAINKDLIDEWISDLRSLVTMKFKNNKVFEVPQEEPVVEKVHAWTLTLDNLNFYL